MIQCFLEVMSSLSLRTRLEKTDMNNRIYNIFTINIDGSGLTRITEDDGESDVLSQISPDGMKICYYTYVF